MSLDLPRSVIEGCPDDLEAAIGFLRAHGLSKIQSMAAIVQKFSLSLPDAKIAVHTSETWRDRRESDDRFHDALFAAFEAGDFGDEG